MTHTDRHLLVSSSARCTALLLPTPVGQRAPRAATFALSLGALLGGTLFGGCVMEMGTPEDEAHADHGPVFVAETANESSVLDQLLPMDDGWAKTPRLDSEEPFKRVGIRFDAAAVVDVEARFSDDDGQTWSEWAPVQLTFQELVAHNAHVDAPFPATAAEMRFRAPIEAALSFAAIELVPFFENAEPEGEGVVDVEAAGSAEQGLAADGIVVTRAAWGARQRNCGGSHSPNRLTVHHTVTPNNDSMSMPARLRQIQAYHIDTRGWCDIGYHFLVGQDGQVYQGRYENKVGAHASGANTHNVGISFVGDFQQAVPPQNMLEAAARIMDALVDTYGIARNRTKIKGHREVGTTSTSCPGNQLFNRLQQLIDLSSSVGGSAPPPPPENNGGGGGGGGQPSPGCYSSTIDANVDHGACVQVTYAGCGLGTCAWYHCNAGSWQCINRESCDDDASHENASCAPAEPPPPPPDPDPTTCYSSTIGASVVDGSCVQVTYAGCGQDGCQWYRCHDGAWQCTDRGTCDDNLAHENDGCAAAPEPPPPSTTASYSDLPSGHWAFAAAEALRVEGAMWGCAPGQFCPDQLVTRAEVAYLFHQLFDGQVDIPMSPLFVDVDQTTWMFDAVQEMAVREISAGCGNNQFCPWDPVSRAAAATFLRRAENVAYSLPASPSFVDVPADHWAYGPIETMKAEGVITGCSTSPALFCPADMLTRAEAAVLFARAYLGM